MYAGGGVQHGKARAAGLAYLDPAARAAGTTLPSTYASGGARSGRIYRSCAVEASLQRCDRDSATRRARDSGALALELATVFRAHAVFAGGRGLSASADLQLKVKSQTEL